jgi:ketopantoate reductase
VTLRDGNLTQVGSATTPPLSQLITSPVYKSIDDAATQVGGKGFDYVVVATKAIPELTTTPQLLEPLLSRPYIDQHKQPVYVLLQNGLGVERDLYEAIRAFDETPRIASAGVWIGTNLVSPGVVEHGSFVSALRNVPYFNPMVVLGSCYHWHVPAQRPYNHYQLPRGTVHPRRFWWNAWRGWDYCDHRS